MLGISCAFLSKLLNNPFIMKIEMSNNIYFHRQRSRRCSDVILNREKSSEYEKLKNV